MSLANELAFIDATSQAELVRKKEVKPIELVDAAIERIQSTNSQLNAVVTPMFDQARAAAKGNLPAGPFTGAPFLLKDLLASYAGVPLTSGSTFTRDLVPDHDSELVARYKRAGLVILGKTNTPEFGILPTTEPALFGPSRNPWDTSRATGGSSGGSAAERFDHLYTLGELDEWVGPLRELSGEAREAYAFFNNNNQTDGVAQAPAGAQLLRKLLEEEDVPTA